MWSLLRRVLMLVGLVVSAAGFVAFAGAAAGVWWLKAEVNRRTETLTAKAHQAVDAAGRAVTFVREIVDQAEGDLKVAKSAAEPAPPANPFARLAARQASENLAGSVDRAGAAVVTASDAVVVAEAALKLFSEGKEPEELKGWLGVTPERLSQTRGELGQASRELKNVRTVLGIPISDGAHPTAEQLVTVESALQRAREITDQMAEVVATTRTRVDETKRAVDRWALRGAVGVTAVGALAALGQFFMARFCWRVLRGRPA